MIWREDSASRKKKSGKKLASPPSLRIYSSLFSSLCSRSTSRSLSPKDALALSVADPRVDTMTTSWAQRAAAAGAGGGGNALSAADAADAAAAAANAAAAREFDSRPHVVLDTNALLLSGNGGAGLARYAGSGTAEGTIPAAVLVTTRAALAEVRDAASREALERLRGSGVCELSFREPEEEDVKAGAYWRGGEKGRKARARARAREREREREREDSI